MQLVLDEGGVSIRHIRPPIGPDFLLAVLHLPSKLHRNDIEQAFIAERVSRLINDAEDAAGHQRTVVIGDLNMNPFDPGLIAANGLNAVMDKKIAIKRTRKVDGHEKRYFYNPMWSRLGDESSGPCGSYYYQSGTVNCHWNMLDQVLLRPDLLPYYKKEDLRIIDKIEGQNLIGKKGIGLNSKFSDHLPVIVDLHIEKGV